MNSELIPPELDIFISLLGEIDMLKNQISVLDKNTHIALSQSDTSAILGNADLNQRLQLLVFGIVQKTLRVNPDGSFNIFY